MSDTKKPIDGEEVVRTGPAIGKRKDTGEQGISNRPEEDPNEPDTGNNPDRKVAAPAFKRSEIIH